MPRVVYESWQSAGMEPPPRLPYTRTCPRCSPHRRADHRRTKCLKIWPDMAWKCFHCGWTGAMGQLHSDQKLMPYEPPPKPADVYEYIPKRIWLPTLDLNTALSDWMIKCLGYEHARAICFRYLVGKWVGKYHDTIFWYADTKGVLMGKVVRYNLDGRRSKNHYPYYPKGYGTDRAPACPPFGLHLMSNPKNHGKDVLLVESEKSAMMASALYPRKVVMALLGAASGASYSRLKYLAGLPLGHVALHLDADEAGREYGPKAAEILCKMGHDAKAYDTFSWRNDGYDYADLFHEHFQ